MTFKEVYPHVHNKRSIRQFFMTICKWLFIFASITCALFNIFIGGKAWSVVAIWSMWLVWDQLLNPDMVEYNRISQIIKLVINSCILLILTDNFLASGWAAQVVPIICSSSMGLVALLLFTDFKTQQRNLLPLILFCFECLIAIAVYYIWLRTQINLAMVIMGLCAFGLLMACFIRLGGEFIEEFKKRFSVK